MRQFIDLTVVGAAFAVGILLTCGAQAEVVSSAPAGQVDAVVDASGCGDPLSGEQLNGLTGGQDIQIERILEQITNANLNGQMTNPSLVGSPVTGYNMLATGALSNVSGIATVIQNSGNQVIINSATILNIFTD